MIARFPQPERQRAPYSDPLALHSESTAAEHEESLVWVRWLFQSIRARCTSLVFNSAQVERVALLEDWQRFVDKVWLPVLAPAMIDAWRAVSHDQKTPLLDHNSALHKTLPQDAAGRSIKAGMLLLQNTKGARYQGELGRLRHEVEDNDVEPHLAMVWVTVAILFQLPPADMLSEYLREEWLTALRECPHHAEPQGPLSFTALAHRSIRESGLGVEFQV